MKARPLFAAGIFSCLLPLFSNAYHFKYSAVIPAADKDGFYRIWLSPAVLGLSGENNAAIRIMNEAGMEIPYLFKTEANTVSKNSFTEYTIVNNVSVKNKTTEVTFKNTSPGPVNNMGIVAYNSDATKAASLSGSNDGQKWFVVKEQFYLYANGDSHDTVQNRLIGFPLVNYKYLKLTISDSLSLPLNILKAGYYDSYTEQNHYAEMSGHRFVQTNSKAKKKSFVTVSFTLPHEVEMMQVVAKSPSLYYRRIEVYDSVEVTEKKKIHKAARYIGSYVLKTKGDSIIQLPSVKTRSFTLVIDNEDNPPLEISGIRLFFRNKYLVAELKQRETYKLMFGDSAATSPTYELAQLQEMVPEDATVLTPGEVVTNQPAKNPKEKTEDTPWSKNPYFIWAALGVGIAALSFLSYKMLTGIKVPRAGV